MSRQFWMLWLMPVGAWAVYMCWLTGYQSGYEAGHDDGWTKAVHLSDDGTARLASISREVPEPAWNNENSE
jgi:hypothetical protein